MAALTADRVVQTKLAFQDAEGVKRDFAVAATTVIYKGGFVGLNAAGHLVMYASPTVGTTIVGGHRFVGIALDHIASQTAAGDATCEALVDGYFEHDLTSAVIADTGKPVFASDDNTLTLAQAGNAYVGFIHNFRAAGKVIVKLDAYYIQSYEVSGSSGIVASAAANLVTMIPKTRNPNGLVITQAFGLCTTTFGGAGVYTLQDTAGTTLGITFTVAATTAANDAIAAAADTVISRAATDANIVAVPAGLGVNIKVTTTQATGAAKFWCKGEAV